MSLIHFGTFLLSFTLCYGISPWNFEDNNDYGRITLNVSVNIKHNKTGVINDPFDQTHSHASSEHCFQLLCFSGFEKWGRTDGHVRKQLSLPAVAFGWPSGSIKILFGLI